MKIVILKNRDEFSRAHGPRLFYADFAGHWQEDGSFLIRKDRTHSKDGVAIAEDVLAGYINRAQENK